MDNNVVIQTLNNLIEVCKDRRNGYEMAADGIECNEFKTLFRSYAQQSGQYAEELRAEVERLGGHPAEAGVSGWIMRGWMNIETAMDLEDEEAIIAACEHGEGAIKRSYENALKQSLPAEALAIVQRQFASIREGHERIRALEMATIES